MTVMTVIKVCAGIKPSMRCVRPRSHRGLRRQATGILSAYCQLHNPTPPRVASVSAPFSLCLSSPVPSPPLYFFFFCWFFFALFFFLLGSVWLPFISFYWAHSLYCCFAFRFSMCYVPMVKSFLRAYRCQSWYEFVMWSGRFVLFCILWILFILLDLEPSRYCNSQKQLLFNSQPALIWWVLFPSFSIQKFFCFILIVLKDYVDNRYCHSSV